MVSRSISTVDIHVGRRLRAARLAQQISQEKLAEGVGLTFQQIQKYENGINRIGTGRLHALATLLEVPVSYFFEGIDSGSSKAAGDSNMSAITEALSTKEGVRIAIALSRIRDPKTRRSIAELLEAMIRNESRETQSLSKV